MDGRRRRARRRRPRQPAGRDGYESITLTSRIQADGLPAKANETVALITGDAAKRAARR